MALEDMLEDMGCALAGSASNLALGLQLAEAVDCEVAILDINITGERSEPLATLLAQRGIPCIYAPGYARAGIGAPTDALVIENPNRRDVVARQIPLASPPPGHTHTQHSHRETS